MYLALSGRKEEISKILADYVIKRPGFDSDEDETATDEEAVFLEAAVMTGHRSAAQLLLNRLARDNHPLVTRGFWGGITSLDRLRGAAAALLGKIDEARQYYQKAIEICVEIRHRPELALSRLQLAELLLEHYPEEKKEALEHLDFAIREFREMKMQPSLERALQIIADRGLQRDPLFHNSAALGISSGQAGELLNIVTAAERPLKGGELTPVTSADKLSPREIEILRLVVAGLSNRQIAERLIISLGTVKTHVHNIFEKLQAKTRTQAVGRARELKLV
jgi:ATP/maltotriose-dependent transcriptional regulator MalT